MTPHALDGAFQRVTRAEEHLTDLKEKIPVVTQAQMSAFVLKFNTNAPYDPKIVIKPSKIGVPMSVGVIIGEVCYNLRSALDYFIFELARHDTGSVQSGTQLPIEDDAEGFARRQKRGWLKGIDAAHVAALERLQPYRGCDWSAALRDLSNRDKHREFVAIGGSYSATVFTPMMDANFSEIALPITRAPHPVMGEVDVKFHATITIHFPDGTPVVETLEKIKAGVAQTLADFKPVF